MIPANINRSITVSWCLLGYNYQLSYQELGTIDPKAWLQRYFAQYLKLNLSSRSKRDTYSALICTTLNKLSGNFTLGIAFALVRQNLSFKVKV